MKRTKTICECFYDDIVMKRKLKGECNRTTYWKDNGSFLFRKLGGGRILDGETGQTTKEYRDFYFNDFVKWVDSPDTCQLCPYLLENGNRYREK